MRGRRWAAALLAITAAVAGCRDANLERQSTAVLGGAAPQTPLPALTDSTAGFAARLVNPADPAVLHARLNDLLSGQAIGS